MKLIIITLTCFFLGACSVPSKPSSSAKSSNKAQVNKSQSMNEEQLLFYLLRKEFAYWQGTPYQLGGNSKKGIDCSEFVKNVYRDGLNFTLPRTTKTQVEKGYLVYKNQLQVGDLVFFKTGWRTRHVGIYIGNNEFIHASTSKGVITSKLDNVYWKKKYWQARRIID
ncbi:NlpC/P60 family protein [Psychromonas sp. Urea-02u-13]|uniref:NlpC/P60 family protein n=1 Tax=Psychromonas sp. Urea-02u-13 TaxID=2058326 RepID=UPI000C34F391|nr:NlpC/P60 family protein [Psychromonas sp. Urea-02u-13]PKG37252.1 hypothetical protein CXF74_19860 [Psychromonas sp. Urea-02u-13]